MIDGFISYDGLPLKSGGAHGLGNKIPTEVYNSVVSFLDKHTESGKPVIELTFYSSGNGEYKTWSYLWLLMRKYGYFPKWDSVNLSGNSKHLWIWTIPLSKIGQAMEDLKYFSAFENEYDPLVLSFYWKVKFIEHETKELLLFQDDIPIIDERNPNSKLYLRLGNKSTISVWFTFPFGSINDTSRKTIGDIIKDLPFKTSDNHWRLWKRSQKNNWIPSKIKNPI